MTFKKHGIKFDVTITYSQRTKVQAKAKEKKEYP